MYCLTGHIQKPVPCAGQTFCRIAAHFVHRMANVWSRHPSVIDNLVKGAAGQAVQNMNLMLGFAEDTALRYPALPP